MCIVVSMSTTTPSQKRVLLSTIGLVILIILFTVAIFGYMHQTQKTVYVVTLSGNALTVNKGDSFLITLESNPSTGYAWALSDTYDTSVVKFNGSNYTDNAGAAIGTPGTEDWSFTGIEKGNTTLEFNYVRSWETNVPPAQSQTYRINVQ